MSERDTHFRGFARCVRKKIEDKIDDMSPDILEVRLSIPYPEDVRREVETLIARAAYDLIEHACLYIIETMTDDWELDEMVPEIPDMTECPEEEESE